MLACSLQPGELPPPAQAGPGLLCQELTPPGAQYKRWEGPKRPVRPQIRPPADTSQKGHLVAQEMAMVRHPREEAGHKAVVYRCNPPKTYTPQRTKSGRSNTKMVSLVRGTQCLCRWGEVCFSVFQILHDERILLS